MAGKRYNTPMTEQQDLPKIAFKTQAEWRAWLEKNHSNPDGIWLQMYKKNSGVTSITYDEALDEGLLMSVQVFLLQYYVSVPADPEELKKFDHLLLRLLTYEK